MTLVRQCLVCLAFCFYFSGVPAKDDIDLSKPFTVPKADVGAALSGSTGTYSTATGTLNSPQLPDPVQRQIQADADAHSVAVATVWLARLTFILAFAAVMQGLMFIWQLMLTRRAANDARTAALAAKASAEAIPLIERAYLFVKVTFKTALEERHILESIGGFTRVRAPIATYTDTIAVSIFNHGKTPAVLRRLRAYPAHEQSQPLALIEHVRANKKIPDGIVVAPNDSYVHEIPVDYDKERFEQLHDVVWRIYCLGLVDYDDVLGNQRTTGFCWQSFSSNDVLDFVISPSTELNYRT
jgi:hypothetical protein